MQAGTYELTASYGCPPAEAGGRVRFTIGDAALEAIVKATGGRNVFDRFVIGRLKLAKGAAWLSAEVAAAGPGELMGLNRIWLRRVGH